MFDRRREVIVRRLFVSLVFLSIAAPASAERFIVYEYPVYPQLPCDYEYCYFKYIVNCGCGEGPEWSDPGKGNLGECDDRFSQCLAGGHLQHYAGEYPVRYEQVDGTEFCSADGIVGVYSHKFIDYSEGDLYSCEFGLPVVPPGETCGTIDFGTLTRTVETRHVLFDDACTRPWCHIWFGCNVGCTPPDPNRELECWE